MERETVKLDLLRKEDIGQRVSKALAGGIPVIYFNAFIVFLGQADVGIVLQANGKETCVLNMSYTTAKTLVEQLGNTIRNFEEKTGNPIMTSDFITKKMGVVQNATS